MKSFSKRPRLSGFDYRGCHWYFITICTDRKRGLFTDGSLVRWLTAKLREKSESFKFKIWAYCFMPDHLHLLVEGSCPGADMRKFVSSFKQLTGYQFWKSRKAALWQPSYYDHVLRNEEDALEVARYILNNPVRKGLVKDFLDYEFTGSFEFDIGQFR